VGLGWFHPVWLQAATVQEPGDAVCSGADQEVGGTGKVAVGRKRRESPDGGDRHEGEI
jgi:hypothetical protein